MKHSNYCRALYIFKVLMYCSCLAEARHDAVQACTFPQRLDWIYSRVAPEKEPLPPGKTTNKNTSECNTFTVFQEAAHPHCTTFALKIPNPQYIVFKTLYRPGQPYTHSPS